MSKYDDGIVNLTGSLKCAKFCRYSHGLALISEGKAGQAVIFGADYVFNLLELV